MDENKSFSLPHNTQKHLSEVQSHIDRLDGLILENMDPVLNRLITDFNNVNTRPATRLLDRLKN